MANHPTTIQEYLARLDKELQQRFRLIRAGIRKKFPDVEEKISYQMPAFKWNGHTVYFAANKNHIGMYPVYGSADNKTIIEKYRGKGTKDSLHFKHKEELPIELIIDLVSQKFRKG